MCSKSKLNNDLNSSNYAELDTEAESSNDLQSNSELESEIQTEVESESQNSSSMSELLENLENSKPKKQTKKKHKKKGPKKDPFIFIHDMHTLDLVHQGWLRVSNPQLKNLNKYSKLRLPDWQEHEIPTGRDYFRKNKAYTGSKSENDPPTDEYFYARLSKRNFWYTVSKDSVHAAGAMSVHEFKTAISLEDYARDPNCFEIKDRKQLNWTLCAQNAAKRNKWVCKIKELLGQSDYSTCVKTIISSDIPTVVKKVFQPVIMLPVASPMCNENYNYDAHGTNWECDCHDGIILIYYINIIYNI